MPIKSEAEGKGNLELIAGPTKQSTYVRGNAFYQLPGGIGGYTFLELYQEGNGYFGKTIFDKKISKGLAAKGEIIHANEPATQLRLGLEAVVIGTNNTVIKIKALPLCVTKQGTIAENTAIGGYFGYQNLGKGWDISSFADINLAAKQGPEWGYGEISLKKQLWDGVSIAYNPALLSKGKLAPKPQHRVTLGIDF